MQDAQTQIDKMVSSITANAPTAASDMRRVLSLIDGRPELAHILPDEYIGKIVEGLRTLKVIELPVSAKKAPSKKVTKTMGGDLDL